MNPEIRLDVQGIWPDGSPSGDTTVTSFRFDTEAEARALVQQLPPDAKFTLYRATYFPDKSTLAWRELLPPPTCRS